jgi:hypothetical protein
MLLLKPYMLPKHLTGKLCAVAMVVAMMPTITAPASPRPTTMVWRVITAKPIDLELLIPGDFKNPDYVFQLDAETLLPLTKALGSSITVAHRTVRTVGEKLRIDWKRTSHAKTPSNATTTLVSGNIAHLFSSASSVGLRWDLQQVKEVLALLDDDGDARVMREIQKQMRDLPPGLREETEQALKLHRQQEKQKKFERRPVPAGPNREANGFSCSPVDWNGRHGSLRACVTNDAGWSPEASIIEKATVFWGRSDRGAVPGAAEDLGAYQTDPISAVAQTGLPVRIQRFHNGVYRLEDLISVNSENLAPELFELPTRTWTNPMSQLSRRPN